MKGVLGRDGYPNWRAGRFNQVWQHTWASAWQGRNAK
jgi:hypothetical protein